MRRIFFFRFSNDNHRSSLNAHVPTIEKASEKLLDSEYHTEHENNLQPTVNYFEYTWIGRPTRRQGRRNPIFSLQISNCYEATKHGLPKTNNCIERNQKLINYFPEREYHKY